MKDRRGVLMSISQRSGSVAQNCASHMHKSLLSVPPSTAATATTPASMPANDSIMYKVVDVRIPYAPSGNPDSRTGWANLLWRGIYTFWVLLQFNLCLMSTATAAPPPSKRPVCPVSSCTSSVSESSSNASTVDETIPHVIVGPIENKESIDAAIGLITDSISQQHQLTAFHVMLHPASITALIIFFIAMLYAPMTAFSAAALTPNPVLGRLLVALTASLTMYITAIELVCSSYEMHAAHYRQNPRILPPTADRFARQDITVAVRRGGEIIAAAVVRVNPSQTSSRRRRAATPPGTAVIRAWTTARAARSSGFGYMVLRAAVKEARVYCGKDVQVSFSKNHANSKRVGFAHFHEPVAQREQLASRVLQDVITGFEAPRMKR